MEKKEENEMKQTKKIELKQLNLLFFCSKQIHNNNDA